MGWLKIQKLEYLENGTLFFYEIKKILNLYLRWHISSSYRFLAEVTFDSIHECSLRIVYGDYDKSFTELLELDNSVSIRQKKPLTNNWNRNLQNKQWNKWMKSSALKSLHTTNNCEAHNWNSFCCRSLIFWSLLSIEYKGIE